ncbi:MAG: aromatic amino acid ammonia-lyase [Spirochaetes bacterium]|nr:aromatic amino acid ammonia-lyase [Spirochaetota bacterium]
MKGETKLSQTGTLVLGGKITLEQFVAVARGNVRVEFSAEYEERVAKARRLIEKAVSENRVMYGVTTGFGALSAQVINRDESARLQRNIIMSHSVSVGEPLAIEQARAVMLMVLQNTGQGFSGIRLEVLRLLRDMLNKGLTPWMPCEGSVGYLAPEAHMSLVLIGEGKAYWKGNLLPGADAMKLAGIQPAELSFKEGLALISGTTSATGLASLALYDMLNAANTADLIAAVSLEAQKGVMRAFDKRVMDIRPHEHQGATADVLRRLLSDSQVLKHYEGGRLQDALSLRCIPQLHGAAKKTLYDAKKTIEIEINSCCDNPVIFEQDGAADIVSACNADSSYVGLAMDCSVIACTMIAKMSERRNNRFLDGNLSGYPHFLVKNPGLNSGLMIPQYTQAGLLGDMRILSTPSVIDNTPTCCNQEDYVAMGYNASKKALKAAGYLEYILAIELLSGYQAQQFIEAGLKRSSATAKVLEKLSGAIPIMEEDMFLHPHIEHIRGLIHEGSILETLKPET